MLTLISGSRVEDYLDLERYPSCFKIQWNSKLQNVPALSTAEELYSIDDLCKDLLRIRKVITDIGLRIATTRIYNNNKPAIRILNSEFISNMTRHIDRSFYHIEHYLANGTFDLQYLSTSEHFPLSPHNLISVGFEPVHHNRYYEC